MKRALLAFTLVAACTRKPETTPDATAPRVDLEPSDAGPPAWPGWPLAADKPITSAMVCQIAFAPNADFHDPCMREYDPRSAMRGYLGDALAQCSVRLERSVLNGRAVIDQAGAKECIEKTLAFRRSGRAEHGPSERACERAVVGRLTAGAMCREEWECAPGLGCANLTKTTPGKCTTPAPANELCAKGDLALGTKSSACAEGLWCGADRCIPTNKEGEGCQPGSCAEGLFCMKGTLKCVRALLPNDAFCKRHDDCDLGHYCLLTTKAPNHCAPQKRAGDKCLESIECAGDCRGGRCVSACGSP